MDFWKTTPHEFWMLYETVFKDFDEPMNKSRLDELIALDRKKATDGKSKT